MASEPGNAIAAAWRAACDAYWAQRATAHTYFWMDGLHKRLVCDDAAFRAAWQRVPCLHCEDVGQAHCLSRGVWSGNFKRVKALLRDNPPYAVKVSSAFGGTFPHVDAHGCRASTAWFALCMAERPSATYAHAMRVAEPLPCNLVCT